jgi:hypothetical protein
LERARDEASAAVQRCSALRPDAADAMDRLGLPAPPPAGSTAAATMTVQAVVAEARDLAYGSTLSEQQTFGTLLTEWVARVFPSELPAGAPGGVGGGAGSAVQYPQGTSRDAMWKGLYEVCHRLCAWLPKLCLALQIDPRGHTSGTATAHREKMLASAAAARQQIQAVERILLHALWAGDPGAAAAAVGCVWAPPEQAQAAQLLGAADSCGLLACLDYLATAGRYGDTSCPLSSLRTPF